RYRHFCRHAANLERKGSEGGPWRTDHTGTAILHRPGESVRSRTIRSYLLQLCRVELHGRPGKSVAFIQPNSKTRRARDACHSTQVLPLGIAACIQRKIQDCLSALGRKERACKSGRKKIQMLVLQSIIHQKSSGEGLRAGTAGGAVLRRAAFIHGRLRRETSPYL